MHKSENNSKHVLNIFRVTIEGSFFFQMLELNKGHVNEVSEYSCYTFG